MDLKFSFNWNNKLDCIAFTTIRIFNPTLHTEGRAVNIFLKEKPLATGVIKKVKPFFLKDLNDYISYLDTGYDVENCTAVLRNMYQSFDFNNKQLALILIVKNKIK
ncbi:hypothetical protein ACFOWM_06180 [Ferruginibacter yonginensis]|uniref:Uncharacterized protein n=1 Tax=Ferruginibacter yonginensis TaxID=1310416 RepID=A0ABV8QU69_9BACT